MNPDYVNFLEILLADDPSLKPAAVLAKFKEHFSSPSDITDSQVKAKFSNLKQWLGK